MVVNWKPRPLLLFFLLLLILFMIFFSPHLLTSSPHIVTSQPQQKQNCPLLIVILSTPHHHTERSLLRSSSYLGYPWEQGGVNVTWCHVFVVGDGGDSEVLEEVRGEAREHGDILLGDFKDSYENLSEKVMFSFTNLFQTHNFTYLIKVDEDSFLNLSFLSTYLSTVTTEQYPGFYAGKPRQGDLKVPKTGKFSLREDWEGGRITEYTQYNLGGGYILSQPAVRAIISVHQAGLIQPVIWEDVYIGMLAYLAGLTPTRIYHYYVSHFFPFCTDRKSILIHHTVPALQARMLHHWYNVPLITGFQLCLLLRDSPVMQYDIVDWNPSIGWRGTEPTMPVKRRVAVVASLRGLAHARKQNCPLLIVILSTPHHHTERSLLRSSSYLGYPWEQGGVNVTWCHVFVVGDGGDSEVLEEVRGEAREHGDILLGDFKDSYENLSEKVMFSFTNLFQTHNFTYLIKVDEDSFLNLSFLSTYLSTVTTEQYPGFYAGKPRQGDLKVPKTGKFSLREDWEGGRITEYTQYNLGGGYILSQPAVQAIISVHQAGLIQPVIWEDVYIGMLAYLAGLTPTRIYHYYVSHFFPFCTDRKSILIHHTVPALQARMLHHWYRHGEYCPKVETEEEALRAVMQYDIVDWSNFFE
eukprot:sb/3462949/